MGCCGNWKELWLTEWSSLSTAAVKRKYPEAEGMDCAVRIVIKYESTLATLC